MCHRLIKKKEKERLQIISVTNDEQGRTNVGCRAMLTAKSTTKTDFTSANLAMQIKLIIFEKLNLP